MPGNWLGECYQICSRIVPESLSTINPYRQESSVQEKGPRNYFIYLYSSSARPQGMHFLYLSLTLQSNGWNCGAIIILLTPFYYVFMPWKKSSLQNPMILTDTTQHRWYMFCLTCPAAKSEDLVNQPALMSWLAICLSDQKNPGNYWPHWERHLRLSQNIDCFSSTKENTPDGILHLTVVNAISTKVWINDTLMISDPFNGFSKVNGMTLT